MSKGKNPNIANISKSKPTGKVKPSKYGVSGRRASMLKEYGPYLEMTPPSLTLAPPVIGEAKESNIESLGMYIPMYDNRKRQQDSIKERLGDITTRLHQTLFDYDELTNYQKQTDRERRASIKKDTENKLAHMEQGEMKDTITALLSSYTSNDVSENIIGAVCERDDLLYQLADWFSADHSELEELDVSMNKEEENEMEQNFNQTVADFEKLKRVQKQINSGRLDTKKLLRLEAEKRKLESSMLNNVKVMKTISIQAFPVGSKDEPPPWKNAADQIVAMLNQVRLEGNDELVHLGAHLKELMKNLDKQQKQIKSLQGELKREKKVVEQLSDENTNLNVDVKELQEKVVTYEEELQRAKLALEKKFSPEQKVNVAALLVPAELMVKKSNVMVKDVKEALKVPSTKSSTSSKSTEQVSKLKLTLSGIIAEFLQDDVPVLETSSDTSVLRSCIRDQREALQLLAQEYKRNMEKISDLEESLKSQTNQVVNLQDENDDLNERLSDLEYELEKYTANKSLEVKASSMSFNCPRCHGKASGVSITAESVQSTSSKVDEVSKWKEKVSYFQKCLADTEMKLSDAYKEISDLRSQMMFEPEKRPSVPPPTPAAKEEEQEEEVEVEEEIKNKRTVQSRQVNKKAPPKRKGMKLPPLPKRSLTGNLTMKESLPDDLDMPDATSAMEEKLWKLGDMQARMTQLMSEILEFIKLVANLIFADPTENAKSAPITTMTTFDFNKNDVKKAKNEDPKVAEGKHLRSQVFFLGQKSIGSLKDAYELLSGSLSLQHDDYELIYRSFKNHQYQRAVRQAVLAGKLPASALKLAQEGKDLKNSHYGRTAMSYSLKTRQNMSGFTGMGRKDGEVWKAVSISSISSEHGEGHKSALNNAVLVLGIHRSKSEVDIHSVQSDVSQSPSLPREHSHTFLSTNASEILRERRAAGLNREETKIPTTTIPKKGLIKLTALNHEVQDPSYYDKKEEENDDNWVRKKPLGHISDPHKPLVKKTMVEHMREGNKMLAEQEKLHHDQEEIEKQLGEYTIGDLHKNIYDITEMSKKKSEERMKTITKPIPVSNKKKQRPPPVERNITLPSIKDFSFG